jgi:Ca2+-binding EF-hand superfamily protein
MTNSFAKVFGFKCDYIAQRIFKILSSGRTLDKPQYLRAIYSLLHAKEEELLNWAFRLYNVSQTGVLRVKEIDDILSALPSDSPAYEE